MKHPFYYLLVILSLFFLIPQLQAAEVDIRSETLMRGFEREIDGDDQKLVLPVYEYLGIDYDASEKGGLSMHLYGWGRKDLAGSGYFNDDSEAELVYGYLQYAKPHSSMRVNIGRQHIFSGITNASVDGLSVETGLGTLFSAGIYGGLPVAYDTDDNGDGQSTMGGRIAHHLDSRYEVGISYRNVITNGDDDIESAGADLAFQQGAWMSVNGLSVYNLASDDWREHNYSARFQISQLAIEPIYHYFQYQDYFDLNNTNNSIFTFLKDSDETLAIAGADLLWESGGRLEVGVRGRSYTYDIREESAQYMAGLLTLKFSGGSQVGSEIGRMDGETPDNTYALYRGYLYWQNPLNLDRSGYISLDALYVAYDAPVYGKDFSVNYTLGAGRSFWNDRIESKLSIIYSQDPYYESDFGGVVTLQIKY